MKRATPGSSVPISDSGDCAPSGGGDGSLETLALVLSVASAGGGGSGGGGGGGSDDGGTSGEEQAKRREREWLAPRTGPRTTRVGDDFQCADLPTLGELPYDENGGGGGGSSSSTSTSTATSAIGSTQAMTPGGAATAEE